MSGLDPAVGNGNTTITYVNSGDGATSDSFILKDESALAFTVNVTIVPPSTPVTVSPVSVNNPQLGVPFSQTLSASGGMPSYSYALSSGTLPAGLSLSTSGTISGTSSATGTFNFIVKVTDSSAPNYVTFKAYAMQIAMPTVSVSNAAMPNGMVSKSYSQQLAASGGTAPYTYAYNSGTFPPGLSISSGGLLSGTPTTAGTWTLSLKATDSTGGAGPYSGARSFSITIDPLPPPPVVGPASSTVAYSSSNNAMPLVLNAGGGGTPDSVALAGGPAHGTAVVNGTAISYTPTPGYAGPDAFTYTGTNAGGTSAAATISITVSAPSLSMTPAGSTLNGAAAGAYTQAFVASGGSASFSYALTGALPTGLAFNSSSGILSGTPTQAGSFPITVTATDTSTGTGPFSVLRNYTLNMAAPSLTLSPSTLTPPERGVGYSAQLTGGGGIAPYSYAVSVGSLPQGLSLAPTTGVLSGTPVNAGPYSFSITATDSSSSPGFSVVQAYSGTVGAGAPVAVASSAIVPYGNTANVLSLSVSGGTPTSVAVTGAPVHGTASASGTSISYTPTAGYAGADSFTYNASNAVGTSASVTVTIMVSPPTLSLAPGGLPAMQTAQPFSQQLNASGGMGPYTYAVTSGTLPAGLTLSTGGLLAGTPTTAGMYSFSVTATDNSSASHFTVQQAYNGSVAVGVPVAAASSATVAYGSAATNIGLSLSGGAPTAVAVVGLPSHGTASVSGASISYTPATGYAGADSFSYNASNAAGTSATVTVTITVSAPTLTLTPVTLLQPQTNVSFSQQLTVAGGMAPYTYAVASGAVPSGMTLSTSGLLAGTPTVGGPYNFTVTATDSSTATRFTVSQMYSGTVGAGAPVALASSATVAYGTANNTINLALSGGMPTSLLVVSAATHGSAVASGTSISYTPTAGYAGQDTFSYNATNAFGTSATAMVTITVSAPALALTPATLTQPEINIVYSQQLRTTGGSAPYTYAVTSGATPAGLSLSSAGLLSGTPTASGPYSFTVTATDSSTATPFTASQTYSGRVGAGAPVAAAFSTTVAYGSSANNINLVLSGGTPTSLSLVSNAAHGVASVSGTTTISYTPTAGYAGADSFTYNASNAFGTSARATVSIMVSAPTLTLAPTTLAQPQLNLAYSQQLTAAGGMAPYTYAVTSGATPSGLTLSGAGLLAGTPTASGPYSFTVTASDSSTATRFTVQQTYTGTVGAGAPVATASSATVAYGSNAVSINLLLSGGMVSAVTVVGNAAHGVATASGASISYTPTAGYAGSDTFSYNASNLAGTSATVTVNITVSQPTLALLPAATSLRAMTGDAYSQGFQASGGTGPYTYVQTGTLPAGLSFNAATATLSGAPTQAGTFSIVIRASDSSTGSGAPFSILRTYTLVVTAPASPALTLNTATLPQPQQGMAYSQQLNASGGGAPYRYAVTGGALPAGLSLSATGLISGTSGAAGAYSFSVTVTDSATTPARATQTYSGSVALGLPVAAASHANVAYGSQANAIPLSLSGGAAASVAVVAAATHGNAVASGTTIRYTPNSGYNGSDGFSYQASNASGVSATVVVNITVAAPALALGSSAPWTAMQGQPYSQVISWSGGAEPYTVATITGLPAGLTVSATSASGVTISGTPTQSGNFTIIASATDSSTGTGAPFTKAQEFVLVVGAPVPAAPSHAASTNAGVSSDVDLTAGALNGPFTAAAVVSVSPANAGTATIDDAGTAASPVYRLRFAAARGYSGVAKVGYTLSNAAGTSPVALVSFTVAARADAASDPQIQALTSAQTEAANRFVVAQLGNFGRRLERLHGDGWARSSFGLTLAPPQPSLRQQAAQWQDGDILRSTESPLQARLRKVGWSQQQAPAAAERKKTVLVQDSNALPDLPGQAEAREAWSLWIDGAIDFGQRNARGEQQGFRFTSNGISTGGDYRFSNRLTLGAGVGFSRANTDVGEHGSKSKASSAIVSVYGSVRPSKATFIDGVIGYGTLDLDTVRYVTDDRSYATATRGGKQQFIALSGGYEYRGEGWMLSPYGRMELAQTTLDKTSETASVNYSLTYFKQRSRVSSGVLGMRSEAQISSRSGVWMPRVRVEYRRQFSGADEAGIAYTDLAGDGPAYVLRSSGQVAATWTAGFGVRLSLSNGMSVLIDYNSNLNSGQGRYQSVLFGVAAPF
ncbi:putative Ig domain-containing protein [Duganella sp. sic0402]|uniref:putative Ig domain-containing protein n=1 Tax=Duganella sp. sic0402 TaxID=2854786 RepID=UPI001C44FF84|nr:putative Ig domain-containing protein [Duganella sp. sic0402]